MIGILFVEDRCRLCCENVPYIRQKQKKGMKEKDLGDGVTVLQKGPNETVSGNDRQTSFGLNES